MQFHSQSFICLEQIRTFIFVSHSFFKHFYFLIPPHYPTQLILYDLVSRGVQGHSSRMSPQPGKPGPLLTLFSTPFSHHFYLYGYFTFKESHYFRQELIFPAPVLSIFCCWAFFFCQSSRRHDLILKQHMFEYTVFS